MNRLRLASLCVLVVSVGLLVAQPPASKKDGGKEKPKVAPGSLEDTLEKAMLHSADIKVAEAKVRDAAAELNRVRHQVLTRATALHHDLDVAKRMLSLAEQSFARQEELVKAGNAPTQTLLDSRTLIEKNRADIEKLSIELKLLRGETQIPQASFRILDLEGKQDFVVLKNWLTKMEDTKASAVAEPRGSASELKSKMGTRVNEWLKKEYQLEAGALQLHVVLDAIRIDTLPFLIDETVQDEVIKVPSGQLMAGAVMQLIQEMKPSIVIVVRDYGIVVTTKEKAPKAGVPILDLWDKP